jgi:hypothetical protein
VLIHGTGSTCNGANTETQQSPPPSHPEWTPEKAANRGEKEHTGARFITSASEKSSTNTAEPGKGGRGKISNGKPKSSSIPFLKGVPFSKFPSLTDHRKYYNLLQ